MSAELQPQPEARPQKDKLSSLTALDELAQHWLNLQCSMLQGVSAAIVVLTNLKDTPCATWPQGNDDYSTLTSLAHEAVRANRCAIRTAKSSGRDASLSSEMLAYPIELDGKSGGAIVIEYCTESERRQQSVINQLRWGSEWLKFAALQNRAPSRDYFMPAVHMIAACLDKDSFTAMANSLVVELAGRFGCERASLGLVKSRQVEIKALSHSASLNPDTNLVQRITAAMEESIDQDMTIVYPPAQGAREGKIVRAHKGLAKSDNVNRICTIPICYGGEMQGALTLEWRNSDACSPMQVQLFEQVATVIGPLVVLKQRDEMSLFARGRERLGGVLKKLFGAAHFRMKLTVALVLLLVVFFSFYKVDYRVSSDAVLQGGVQRVLAAPHDSYINTASARAGDFVTEGQVLGTLDDKELRLERLKWLSEKSQYSREYRDALAKRANADVQILSARIRQAEAQIALLDEKLLHTQITAPFDGVIIEGDPSQSLGAPVRRGDLLFKLAPLEDYRIIIKVDERDIRSIREGQVGQLSLASLPETQFDLEVSRITPVSVAEQGGNYFRVEADLIGAPEQVRPGMEGVAKVVTEPRHLIWVWGHRLVDWLRLQFWAWSPW